MRVHEPSEFLSMLSLSELPDPAEVSVFGIVKVVEGSSEVVDFTTSLRCENWLQLPVEMVDSFTHLKNIPCQDHEHPLVRVKFKQPDEARQDLAFLLKMLSWAQSSSSRLRRRPTRVTPSEREDGCDVWELGGEYFVCCQYAGGVDCTGIV
ncbi:hypothetical protein [Streptomyces sp. NPDC093591]|uniref:hypothetical protein n=1 Tax=Streptomyces sp. NPDC093591 TaxID=3366044 RepID=UPI0037F505D2